MLVQNSSSNIYATQGVINRSSGPVNQQAFDTNSVHNSQLRDSLQSSGGIMGMDSGLSPNTVIHQSTKYANLNDQAVRSNHTRVMSGQSHNHGQ